MAVFDINLAKTNAEQYKPTFLDNIINEISTGIETNSNVGFNSLETNSYPKVDRIDTEDNPNRKLLDSDIKTIMDTFEDAGYEVEMVPFLKTEVKFIVRW
jgi:hypothetical protein